MSFKLIGELIGAVAIVSSFFIYVSNNRKKIILVKGVSDVLWAVNSFLIGAFTGGMLNLIMVFREFVFYHRLDKKWAQHKIWLYVFCMVCFVSPVLEIIKTGSFAILPFFPACGSVAAVFGFYAKKPSTIRALNVVTAVPWIIYSAYMNNITSCISGLVALCSILIGTIRAKKMQQNDKAYVQGENDGSSDHRR